MKLSSLWAARAGRRRLMLLCAPLALAPVLTACSPSSATGPAAAASAPAAPILTLGAEDIWTLGASGSGVEGPALTGTLQAERRADLRAELSAVVLRVARDNGDPVRRGELLVKLDDTALRDSLASAEEAVRASERALDSAERQLQRLKSLQAQGMSSLQALDDAEVRRNAAQSEAVAARARQATARQQLERTEVRAPFDGVVSARKVSAGDTASLGRELIQVVDPASVRFDAWVSAEQVGRLRVGQPVVVRVQGREGGELTGRVRRVDAVAQPVTRQVAVIVDLPSGAGRPGPGSGAGLIPGLYAEGRVAAGADAALVLPETALVRRGETVQVWRLDGGLLRLQPVRLAPRDSRTGLFAVTDGLKAGDRVLRSPGSRPVEGQRFSLRGSPPAVSAPRASDPSRRDG